MIFSTICLMRMKTVVLDRFTVDRGCAACLTNWRALKVVTSNSTGFVLIQYFLSLEVFHIDLPFYFVCVFSIFPFSILHYLKKNLPLADQCLLYLTCL